MSTRPTGTKALSQLWADTGTLVTPSSAKILAGWKTGERPPAQYKNWWANRVDTWLKYFADGDIALNNLAVGGTLGVTGATTLSSLAASGNATVGGTLGVTGAATLSSFGASGNGTVGGTLGVTGVLTATAGLTTPGGVTYTGSADEHHPDREFSIDCTGFVNDFGGTDTSQGGCFRFAFDGSNAVILHSMFVGAGNASGALALNAPLERIRVGDKITHIEVVLARASSPDGSEVLVLEANGPTSTSENAVFTSGTITRPGANAIAAFDVTGINYTHVANTGLRLRIRTSSTATGGTIYLRYVRVFFQRP